MRTKSDKQLWWISRILSGLLIVFSLSVIGLQLTRRPLSTTSIIGLSIIGLYVIGLGLAWKWELIGGIIALAAFIGASISEPSGLTNPPIYLYPATAILFIVLWAKSRNTTVKNK